MTKTTLSLDQSTLKKLASMKIIPRETYDELLNRIFKALEKNNIKL